MTAAPRWPKNCPKPIGETLIGRHGRKYRVVSNGEKKPTPRPPLVIESRNPWEAVARKKNTQSLIALGLAGNFRRTIAVTTQASTAAKNSECERWPSM